MNFFSPSFSVGAADRGEDGEADEREHADADPDRRDIEKIRGNGDRDDQNDPAYESYVEPAHDIGLLTLLLLSKGDAGDAKARLAAALLNAGLTGGRRVVRSQCLPRSLLNPSRT
jgi:hypothetical protein